MSVNKLMRYKMFPVFFIVAGMALICEYVLEYNFTRRYFSMSTTGWLFFAISEFIFDVILYFVLYIAYKLDKGGKVAFVLSIAFGCDALFLLVGIVCVLSSIQMHGNDEVIIKHACNMLIIYFARHFMFIVLISVIGFNYTLKNNKKHGLLLFLLLSMMAVFFCFYYVCIYSQ